ncbi:MAG TPA: SLBB domain-containing protein [Gemmatimonadales bacterium]|nr:SLBB domain-containing protein [Gemmatimonadales bacterium]
MFTLLAVLPAPAWVQQPSGTAARRLLATRLEVQSTLDSLRQLRDSHPSLTGFAGEISALEQRLESGDFRVGDRVLIRVEDPLPVTPAGGGGTSSAKSPEQQLSDTFTVNGAQALPLPLLGDISLRGVLRSEIEPYLTTQIGTRIRDPEVHARALIVVAVSGGVLKPGYYAVSPDALVGAVINAAGGGIKEGKITDLKIVHHGTTIWKSRALQRAIAEGRTLDDLQVQPGDVIAVGLRDSPVNALRTIAVILSIPVAILTISRF